MLFLPCLSDKVRAFILRAKFQLVRFLFSHGVTDVLNIGKERRKASLPLELIEFRHCLRSASVSKYYTHGKASSVFIMSCVCVCLSKEEEDYYYSIQSPLSFLLVRCPVHLRNRNLFAASSTLARFSPLVIILLSARVRVNIQDARQGVMIVVKFGHILWFQFLTMISFSCSFRGHFP